MEPVRWFDDIGLADVDQVGGKGANLGELTRAGLPVPRGFVVTSGAFLEAIALSGVRDRLRELVSEVAPDDAGALSRAAEAAQELVRSTPVPGRIGEAVIKAYHELGDRLRVAVRSSATAEDAGDTSFAGMNATFTNVTGDAEVLARLSDCWASLYGERVVAYRANGALTDEPAIAVVVQEMVPSERSGVMFTADPVTGDTDRVVIEAVLGLGESIVSGAVEPDTYVVSKATQAIVSTRVGRQSHMIVLGDDGHDLETALTPEQAAQQVLDQREIVEVAGLALKVEQHYRSPQDIEWAIAGGATYLVQSRPITTLTSAVQGASENEAPVLVTGLGASAGTATGAVRVLTDPAQRGLVQPGEVLVATMSSPDWMSAMR